MRRENESGESNWKFDSKVAHRDIYMYEKNVLDARWVKAGILLALKFVLDG